MFSLIIKPGLLFTLLICITQQPYAQKIEGRVIDSHSGDPLEYVGIGIVNTRAGAITDKNGYFRIEAGDESPESIVRISMIGYEPQVFSVEELKEKHKIIRLIEVPVLIEEVIIKPFSKSKKLGTDSYNRIGNWCGWGGSSRGSGHEIGTRIDLGSSPVFIRSLHVHVHRQAFDTSLFRLHIRSITDTIPSDELLNTNILFPVTKESGWIDIDLSSYNIVLEGDVILTLEWIKVSGMNEDRAMTINNRLTSEYILFNTRRKQGCTYTRWGVEADWTMHNNGSPSIYITIQE